MAQKTTVLNQHALNFIERTGSSDPALHEQTQLILDTNVFGEIYSIADLLTILEQTQPEEALHSQKLIYRQDRAKHSIILAWWLSNNGVKTGFPGAESIHILTENLAPDKRPASFGMTRAIVHIIRPMVLKNWNIGTLNEADHTKTGTDADTEILRLAKDNNLPLITWEGWQEDNTFSKKPRCLRNRCFAEGVSVFSPREYLEHKKIDLQSEASAFVSACENASWMANWENKLPGRKAVDLLIQLYRFILFDEISETYTHLRRLPPQPEL